MARRKPPPPFGILHPASADTEHLPTATYPFFVQDKSRFFVSKPTFFGHALVPVPPPQQAIILDTTGEITLNTNKVPGYLITQVTDWFRKMYDRHQAEAVVILTSRAGQWRAFIPEQYASGAGVNMKYDLAHIAPGWQQVGTIHSHCNMAAFHSGTDMHDADGFEGLHITIGHLGGKTPQFAQMIALNKTYINLEYDQAVDASAQDGPTTAPAWWDRYHHTGTAPWGAKGISYSPKLLGKKHKQAFAHGFQFTDYHPTSIPTGWHQIYEHTTRYVVPHNILARNNIPSLPWFLPNRQTWHDYFQSYGVDLERWKYKGSMDLRPHPIDKLLQDWPHGIPETAEFGGDPPFDVMDDLFMPDIGDMLQEFRDLVEELAEYGVLIDYTITQNEVKPDA